MNKKVGAILSVLKPVDDTRMYEKMAQSLAHTGKFSVNILGFSSNTHSTSPDIIFHTVSKFTLRNYRRLLANITVFRKLLGIKPTWVIVCTAELTPTVLFYRLFYPSLKIIYDIQENHTRNIIHHHQLNPVIRRSLAFMVKYLERQIVRHSSLLLVAERGYYREMLWLNRYNNLLVENKVLQSDKIVKVHSSSRELKLLYTGTISTIYGIWDALRFVERMKQAVDLNVELMLVGHVTQAQTYEKLSSMLPDNPWIRPTISLYPVPHSTIMSAMAEADFGLVCHRILPSTENCFPTRIWEYMSKQLPFFLQNHQPWVAYCSPWQCAIPVDFTQDRWSFDEITQILHRRVFYSNGKPKDIYWPEKTFVSAIESVTFKK